jgi:hypothetical protein
MTLNDDFLHVAAIHRPHEFAKHNLWFASVLFAKYAENHQEN